MEYPPHESLVALNRHTEVLAGRLLLEEHNPLHLIDVLDMENLQDANFRSFGGFGRQPQTTPVKISGKHLHCPGGQDPAPYIIRYPLCPDKDMKLRDELLDIL